MATATVRANGIELHVEHDNLGMVSNAGWNVVHPVPLVMVHGWTADRFRNYPVYQHLKERGWPVLIYDLRGHGWSQKGLGSDAYTIGHCVDDLDALLHGCLLEDHGVGKVALYGHSMGGTIVLEWMRRQARAPSSRELVVSVNRLFLVAPYAGWSVSADMRAGFEMLLGSYEKRFDREFKRKKREQAKLGLEFFPHWNEPGSWPERDATIALGKEMMARGVSQTVLDEVKVPVHVFVGSKDRPDLRQDARLLAAKVPGATLDILPCGHNYAIECKDTFPAMVHAYLAGGGKIS